MTSHSVYSLTVATSSSARSTRLARTLALATACSFVAASAVAQSTQLVSVGLGGASANQAAFLNDMTPDARFVVFHSAASNLVAGDTNGVHDMFLRDRVLGITERVSVSSAGVQGDDGSGIGGVSADGRFVVFMSRATNLVSPAPVATHNVYLRDRATGVTTLVSVDSAGVPGNATSTEAVISGDGRFVAFSSYATNLVAGDTNAHVDLFRHDRLTGTTICLSVDAAGVPAGSDSYSEDGRVSLSADGNFAAFISHAPLAPPVPVFNTWNNVFVRDVAAGVTSCVTVSPTGVSSDRDATAPSITPDGRYVVFQSFATNLVPPHSTLPDVYLYDGFTGQIALVSQPGASAARHGSFLFPGIAGAGGFAAFYSDSPNLVAGDTNARTDLFLRDLATGTIVRADTDSLGAQSSAGSDSWARPAMLSTDARFVAFTSAAALAPFDANGDHDVFIVDRLDRLVPFCGFDGAAAHACPCANGAAGRGCANSAFANGAELVASGDTSVSNDTVQLEATSLTGSVAIFYLGDGAGPRVTFDDGQNCVGGSIVRIGTKPVGGNASVCPEPGDLPLSATAGVPAVGGRRFVQCVYRNTASFCTAGTSNRTNAVAVTFVP